MPGRKLVLAAISWMAILSTIVAATAAAQDEIVPAFQAGAGEAFLDYAWNSRDLVVVTECENIVTLYLLAEAKGQAEHLGDISLIDITGGYLVALSPAGNGIAILAEPDNPLATPGLEVYRLSRTGLDKVAIRMPADFSPSQISWEADGSNLLVAAEPYIHVDQVYSLASINLATGRFSGLVLKANVDLVQGIWQAPGSQRVLLKAAGFQGDYPSQSMYIAYDLGSRDSKILQVSTDYKPNMLASGDILFESEDQGNWRPKDLPASYLLPASMTEAEEVSLGNDVSPGTFALDNQGRWLAYVSCSLDSEGYLVLQDSSSGEAFLSAAKCTSARFSPNAEMVAMLDSEAGALYTVDLHSVRELPSATKE